MAGDHHTAARPAPWPPPPWPDDLPHHPDTPNTPDGPDIAAIPPPGLRADAGTIRLTDRDIWALPWIAEMYAVQADHLAELVGASHDVVRQLTARWRKASYAETATLGPGPVWCWLTRHGLDACGLPYAAKQPALARLRHLRAVAAVRLTLQTWPPYHHGHAHWRSERRLRWRLGPGVGRAGHIPDAEILWPHPEPHSHRDTDHEHDAPGSNGYAGQIWCIEAELTPKTTDRTAAIMAELLARTTDYGHHSTATAVPRYTRVLYLTTPAARPTVEHARAALPEEAARRVDVRPLPDGATP